MSDTQEVQLNLNLTDVQEVALEVALLRAIATERTEAVRARTLVVTGYGDRAGGTLAQQADSAVVRMEALQAVLDALRAS